MVPVEQLFTMNMRFTAVHTIILQSVTADTSSLVVGRDMQCHPVFKMIMSTGFGKQLHSGVATAAMVSCTHVRAWT